MVLRIEFGCVLYCNAEMPFTLWRKESVAGQLWLALSRRISANSISVLSGCFWIQTGADPTYNAGLFQPCWAGQYLYGHLSCTVQSFAQDSLPG